MSGHARKSVSLSLVLWPSERSSAGAESHYCEFESRNEALIEAVDADIAWFRANLGELVRIRPRIYGEFDFMEADLPPFLLVESSLTPDGRLFRRPIFPREVQ